MTGTWTYDPTANTIALTGGTLASPAGFVDAWNADKAGTLQLLTATQAPFSTITPTRQVRPADSLSLQLSLIITNFSTLGTLSIIGTDQNGQTINVSGAITQNATYLTSLAFTSITSITAEGNYTLTITQPRWGIVSRQATNGSAYKPTPNKYDFVCNLQIGDGTNVTYFADTERQISFSGNHNIRVKNNATFRLGEVQNSTDKTGRNGCQLLFNLNSGVDAQSVIYGDASSYIYLYACSIYSKYQYEWIKHEGTNGTQLVCWQLSTNVNFLATNGDICDFYMVTLTGWRGIALRARGTMDSIYVMGRAGVGNAWVFGSDGNWGVGATNAVIRNVDKIFRANGITVDCSLTNVDSDVWSIQWDSTSAAKVNRKYTLYLTILDAAGLAVQDATISLIDKDGREVFLAITDTNGKIATQTITLGYYSQTTGDMLQQKGPFTINIIKTGKMPYSGRLALDSKTALVITIRDQLSGSASETDVQRGKTFYKDDANTKLTGLHVNPAVFIDVATGKPVLNINRKNSDNQLVLGL